MEALQDNAVGVGGGEGTSTGSASSLHLAKRALLVRDSLTFLVLLAATLVLYAATSFLFRSFEERRDDLAREYTGKGKAALAAQQPEQAIRAFRTALSYAPDDRTNHLLLAEALAEAHHREEATSYFLSLRDTQPADGFINLQLARLAREKGDRSAAIEYYRAASLGTWDGDSVNLRRTVQVELADYLIDGGDLPAARAEILLAAANTPETLQQDLQFGDRLLHAQDSADALMFYRKAVQLDPHDVAALTKAGEVLYGTGEYASAHEFLERAARQEARTAQERAMVVHARTLAGDAERIQQLTLTPDLSAAEFGAHLRTDVAAAKKRLSSCVAHNGGDAAISPDLQRLTTEWQSAEKGTGTRSSMADPADQDYLKQLIFDTEIGTAQACGSPSGDDALLLQLAQGHAAR